MFYIGLLVMYKFTKLLLFIPGKFFILFEAKLAKDSFYKFFIDLSNHYKSYNFELEIQILFKAGIFGNTCTLLTPVASTTNMNK